MSAHGNAAGGRSAYVIPNSPHYGCSV